MEFYSIHLMYDSWLYPWDCGLSHQPSLVLYVKRAYEAFPFLPMFIIYFIVLSSAIVSIIASIVVPLAVRTWSYYHHYWSGCLRYLSFQLIQWFVIQLFHFKENLPQTPHILPTVFLSTWAHHAKVLCSTTWLPSHSTNCLIRIWLRPYSCKS